MNRAKHQSAALPDEQAAQVPAVFPAWDAARTYEAGSDIVCSYQQFEERTEEVVAYVQVLVSVNYVAQIHTALPNLFVAHITEVYAVA